MKKFSRGEKVLVRDDFTEEWTKRIFLAEIE
jgi:hypothetical protein